MTATDSETLVRERAEAALQNPNPRAVVVRELDAKLSCPPKEAGPDWLAVPSRVGDSPIFGWDCCHVPDGNGVAHAKPRREPAAPAPREHGRSAPGDHQKPTSVAGAVIYLPIVWTVAACVSR